MNGVSTNHLSAYKKWHMPFSTKILYTGKKLWKNIPRPIYGWVVEMSECSAACGGGFKNISVLCQTGSTVVDDGFCANLNKPGQTGLWPCNTQPCLGRWQEGSWESCSVTCGQSIQRRDVVCVQQVSQNIFSMVQDIFCPR
ncbi:A disintegrin and metalloproteinase with thrombospondin motifs 19, partial [Stegodyphus mimosarum]